MDQTKPVRSCALCGAVEKLEQSHIIPQFVYRWQRGAAKSTEPHHGPASNRRTQDGPTRPMLCGQCEDLFSSYESEFARLVFHPFATSGILAVKYSGWLRKFAVSVCWRIIEENIAENMSGHLHEHERWARTLALCRERWKQYLCGKQPDVGGYHIHLLQAKHLAGDERPPLAGTLLGYLQHTIEGEVSCNDTGAFIYAKLGPLILLGLIADPDSAQWRGTRINPEGKLKPRDVFIPVRYRDYIFSRAYRQLN